MRTARPELVRRALLLLEGSPAVLDMSDAFRMAAAEGGIVVGEEVEVVVVVFAGLASVCVAAVEVLLKARSHEEIT